MKRETPKKVRLCYPKSKQIPEFTDEFEELVEKLDLETDGCIVLLTKHNAEAIEKEIEQETIFRQ